MNNIDLPALVITWGAGAVVGMTLTYLAAFKYRWHKERLESLNHRFKKGTAYPTALDLPQPIQKDEYSLRELSILEEQTRANARLLYDALNSPRADYEPPNERIRDHDQG